MYCSWTSGASCAETAAAEASPNAERVDRKPIMKLREGGEQSDAAAVALGVLVPVLCCGEWWWAGVECWRARDR
eukprot:scaffold4044_cov399-Prasinococcus_capsulatus_cf.AAC.6